MIKCNCIYCISATKAGIDFVSAVVGMKLPEAQAFLCNHKKNYQIIRRDGILQTVPLIACNLYLEVNNSYVIAAYENATGKWD